MSNYNPRSPRQAYGAARKSAYERAIDFELTFVQWWQIWQASGHFEQRGRNTGCYVMRRVDAQAPFRVGNVTIEQRLLSPRWKGRRNDRDAELGSQGL